MCGLCFWASDTLIERFYKNLSIKGSEAHKLIPYELLWMLWFDEKSISTLHIYTLIVRQIFNIYESSRNILPSNIIEKVFSPMTKRLESKQYPTLAILGIADVFFIHEHKWKLLTLLGIRITATVIWLIGSEERTSKYYSLVDWSISIFFGSFLGSSSSSLASFFSPSSKR